MRDALEKHIPYCTPDEIDLLIREYFANLIDQRRN